MFGLRGYSPSPSAPPSRSFRCNTPPPPLTMARSLSSVSARPQAPPRAVPHVGVANKKSHPLSKVELEAEPYPLADVSTFEAQIRELHKKASGAGSVTLSASPSIWAAIFEKYGETVDEKLEYIDGHIIVTWPYRTHEVLRVITSAFLQIESQRSEFLCGFNESILIPGRTDKPVPDLALIHQRTAKQGGDLHLLILEWAASQPASSLDEKAEMWFLIPSVQIVITVNLDVAQYSSPAAQPTTSTVTYTEFCEAATVTSTLGPVSYQGHTFHHEVKKVTMHIYRREGNAYTRKRYNITPCELTSEVRRRFDKATEAVALAVRRAVGVSVFDACFSGNNRFDLRWDTFPVALTDAMMHDSYTRYATWSNAVSEKSIVNPLKRKAGDNSDDESDSDASERNAVASVTKKLCL
ncbi:hypothetical protein B0H11DRAFT_2078475 [Mycena galericulata]|nr:hypothetical protein B0H11DRAFT_2078475 [Mycena galericulata]